MVELYACTISETDPAKMYRYLSLVSKEKQKRIRESERMDGQQTFIADLLIRYIIIKKYGITNEQIQFGANQWEKPFLIGKPDFHFNLSHSAEWVVCAIDSSPIGIDVEKLRPIDYLGIAERYFSPFEYQELMRKEKCHRLEYFYDIWTLKESYVKALGTGLNTSLWKFTIAILDGNVCLYSSAGQSKHAFFKQFSIEEGYKLSVCSFSNDFSDHITFLGAESLVEEILKFEPFPLPSIS